METVTAQQAFDYIKIGLWVKSDFEKWMQIQLTQRKNRK